MRSLEVVEINHLRYFTLGVIEVLIHLMLIYPFHFERAVLSFGHGVVRWFVTFGHADSDVVTHKRVNVFVTGILHASVRVVYGSAKVVSSGFLDGHEQCLPGVLRLHGL